MANKTIKLPSGASAEITPLTGRIVFATQKQLAESEGDKDNFMKILIAATVKIDGKSIVPEDLDDMNGWDVLELMGEFGAASFLGAA